MRFGYFFSNFNNVVLLNFVCGLALGSSASLFACSTVEILLDDAPMEYDDQRQAMVPIKARAPREHQQYFSRIAQAASHGPLIPKVYQYGPTAFNVRDDSKTAFRNCRIMRGDGKPSSDVKNVMAFSQGGVWVFYHGHEVERLRHEGSLFKKGTVVCGKNNESAHSVTVPSPRRLGIVDKLFSNGVLYVQHDEENKKKALFGTYMITDLASANSPIIQSRTISDDAAKSPSTSDGSPGDHNFRIKLYKADGTEPVELIGPPAEAWPENKAAASGNATSTH